MPTVHPFVLRLFPRTGYQTRIPHSGIVDPFSRGVAMGTLGLNKYLVKVAYDQPTPNPMLQKIHRESTVQPWTLSEDQLIK